MAKKNTTEEEVELEPVLETRPCLECQGDGVWDGVVCETCLGTGKIFKDDTVVGTKDGTYIAKGGLLKKVEN